MSQKPIVTQGELKNTISGLDALANNLNDHVNSSMSKSHGWTGMDHQFFDSGGCCHTNTPGRVLRIAMGNQIYYAPAQLSGGIDGHSDPVLPPYTGIISPQNSDPALDLTVGSPTVASLATEFAGSLNIIAGASDTTLLTHAGIAPESVHSGLAGITRYTRDSAAHIVGRRGVIIVIGGSPYLIVCDHVATGPTQPTRFTNTCPQILPTSIISHGSSLTYQQTCYWKDETNDDPMCDFVVEMLVQGTPPILWKYQYCTNAANPTWTNLGGSGIYGVNNGFQIEVLQDGAHAGDDWIIGDNPSGTTSASPPAVTPIRLGIRHHQSNKNGTNFAYGIRVIADNSAVDDGAVIASDMLSMAMVDHTGCC